MVSLSPAFFFILPCRQYGIGVFFLSYAFYYYHIFFLANGSSVKFPTQFKGLWNTVQQLLCILCDTCMPDEFQGRGPPKLEAIFFQVDFLFLPPPQQNFVCNKNQSKFEQKKRKNY